MFYPYFQVNVFFSSFTYENIVEVPAMTGSQMMANLGGAISLYLGVSFVAAFEVFELIIRLIFLPLLFKKKQWDENKYGMYFK